MFKTSVCIDCLAGLVGVLRQRENRVHVCQNGENLANNYFFKSVG